MRILVVWEDREYESLGEVVRALRTAFRPTSQPAYPELLFHTASGNGNFARYAGQTWRNVRAKGLPNSPGAIDHLVCVVDADKLAELVPAAGHPPVSVADVPRCHQTAEQAFVEKIRGACSKSSTPPHTVHGIALRWCKESIVLGAYDNAAFKDKLGIDVEKAGVAMFLAQCSPRPDQVEPRIFSDTYRQPVRCIDGLLKAQGLASLGKCPEHDDTLRALKGDSLGKVCERVPDLERLLRLVWRLAEGPKNERPKSRTQTAPAKPTKKSKARG